MKIKKSKRLLALILCMALVLGTNTFTMAADASQSQEEIVQDESISQEGTGTEEVQTQALEETGETVPEPTEEQTEEPGQEETQGQTEGTSGTETEEMTTEEPGTEENTPETVPEENGEEVPGETPTDITESTEGLAESAGSAENTGTENSENPEDMTTDVVGETGQEEDTQKLQYEDEYVLATATVPNGSFSEDVSLQIGYGDETIYKEIEEILSSTITENNILQYAIQDISFVDADGNIVEPSQNVEVQITYKQPIGAEEEVKKISAYHMVTDTEMYAVNLEETGELLQIDTSDGKNVDGFTISCSSFSPFVLVWENEKAELKTNVVTDAGPIIENIQAASKKSANAVLASSQEETPGADDGVELSKTAEVTGDGQYKIRMEAYTTGTVTNSEKSLPVDIILVLDQSGSMAYDFGSGWNPPSRQDAMQSAVKSFISQVADANDENQIGIITFANGANVRKNLQNAKDNKQSLLDSIDWLGNPDGATNVAAGMEEAVEMLPNQVEGRNRVVIVFTDGVPTTNSEYATSVADSAIASSKQIKDSGATVYTVGIFDGANPEQLYLEGDGRKGEVGDSWDYDTQGGEAAAANRYMNYLSSNYNDAQSDGLKEIIEYIIFWPYLKGWEIEQNYTRTTTDDYYLSAEDSEDLNDIFEKIGDQITTPSIELGEDAYVQDVISDAFKLPEDVDSENIGEYVTVKTCRKTANGWGNEETLDNAVVELSLDGKTIKVKGFNFDENVVSEDPRENPNDPNDKAFYGRKLIIEFNVQPAEDFIGGNAVETNAANSAIYDSEGAHIEEFPRPAVNVPIYYEYKAENKSIYIGDSWKEVEQFFDDITQERIQYQKSENGRVYTLNGKNNEYVEIVYTIKEQDGDLIGTYTVNPGESEGSWETNQPNIDTTKLTECTQYTVTVDVTSKNEAAQGQNKGTAEDIKNKVPYNNRNPWIHVFVPQISVEDQKIFLGESVNLKNSVKDAATEWRDVANHTDNVPTLGNPPSLDFDFEWVSGTALGDETSYFPEKDSNFNLKVKRADTQKDITDSTTITNSGEIECGNDCYKPDISGEKHDFTIHVVAGKIEITKVITNKGNSAIEGDPIFTFKIEYRPSSGVNRKAQVYYRTIRFTGNDEGKTAELLEGLPKGDYTVTELTTQKYQFTGSSTEGSTCSVGGAGEKTVTFYIGQKTGNIRSLEARTGKVIYTNNKTGPSTNTDTDTIVNRYVYDEEKGEWKVSQIKVPGEGQEEEPVNSGSGN